MNLHQSAEVGFGAADNPYEQGRPDYPAEALRIIESRLGSLAGKRVLELGAGTGKFTALLRQAQAEVIAVEPIARMRESFAEKFPGITVLDASATDIPLGAACVPVVFAAQAFHWFASYAALKEIPRVLEPGGTLCLIWNVRDSSVDWIAALNVIIHRYSGHTPRYKSGEWKEAFEEFRGFSPLAKERCSFAQQAAPELIEKRIASTSFIAALAEQTRRVVPNEVREILSTHPETKNKATLPFAHFTDIYFATKAASGSTGREHAF
jgi:SAM-dependent methyltransferase